MNFKILKKYILALGMIIPLLIAISFVQTKINRIKKEDKLTDTAIVKNAPPVVAFVTIVLGSFRGLLADILWLRSTILQDEGKYYEMVQLASWMTKLQPRFTGATTHLAWNLAFNISVTCSSHADRWRWVQRGIELIRDEALLYNPSDPLLYKELAWFYQFKIGNILDDANQYYKNRLALDMMEVFGKDEADWEALAAAPKNEKELQEVLRLDDKFWKDLGAKNIDQKDKYTSFADIEKDFKIFGKIPKKVRDVLNNDNKSLEIMDNYFRAKWLRDQYKIEPKTALKINEKYGKLDWRLPEAHAIYWATKGIENDKKGLVNVDCERVITQSIKDAFMGGKLLMVDKNDPQTFSTMPNLDISDAAIEAYKTAQKRQKVTTFKSALDNFLKDIIVTMYTFGKYSKAKKYLKMLRKDNPGNKAYWLPLDQFAMKEWREDASDATAKQAYVLVTGLIYRSLYLAASGEQEAAVSHLKLAKSIYRIYQSENKKTQVRQGMEPFNEIQKNVTQAFKKRLGIKDNKVMFSLPNDEQDQIKLKENDKPDKD